MRTRNPLIAAVAFGSAMLLTGCTGTFDPSPSPVRTIEVDELNSDSAVLGVGETLSIDAADHPDAYRAIVIDASVAEFIPGATDPDAANPSILGVAPGETEVVLSDPAGELDDISFTLIVTK